VHFLMHTLQTEMLNTTEFCKVSMKTIQLKLIKVAARVKIMKTKVKIELPKEFYAKWVFEKCKLILEGKTQELILELDSSCKKVSKSKSLTIQKAIKYFTNHLQYMQYDQYLKKGYPIASGVVESACSQVVANRCELPGARWSINGAEAMLKIRSVTSSNLWDKYWDYTNLTFAPKLTRKTL